MLCTHARGRLRRLALKNFISKRQRHKHLPRESMGTCADAFLGQSYRPRCVRFEYIYAIFGLDGGWGVRAFVYTPLPLDHPFRMVYRRWCAVRPQKTRARISCLSTVE